MIYGRIVDVAGFLERYRTQPDISGRVTLHITDPLLEWNNASFNLAVHDGHCALSDQSAPYEASMSIGTLTTLLLGYKRASDLAVLEKLSGDSKAIEFLDRALIYKKPYISDYI